jgi:hypothetical protein
MAGQRKRCRCEARKTTVERYGGQPPVISRESFSNGIRSEVVLAESIERLRWPEEV